MNSTFTSEFIDGLEDAIDLHTIFLPRMQIIERHLRVPVLNYSIRAPVIYYWEDTYLKIFINLSNITFTIHGETTTYDEWNVEVISETEYFEAMREYIKEANNV